MIPFQVFQVVFHIKYKASAGSCFTITHDGKQYLVTAKHLFEERDKQGSVVSIDNPTAIEINRASCWETYPVKLVGHSSDADISVLATDRLIEKAHPKGMPPAELPEADLDGIVPSQDVYFVGFPYQMASDFGGAIELPPLVKKATLSGIIEAKGIRPGILVLDGHNNKGFSGGPVFFNSVREKNSMRFKIAGVVCNYISTMEIVLDNAGNETPLRFRENTGLFQAHPITVALMMIEQNPIGFQP